MAMQHLTVRPAELADALDLRIKCLATMTLEAVRAQLAQHLREAATGEGVQVVALAEGSVVGYLVIRRASDPRQRHRARLHALVVSSYAHGQGVARKLLEGVSQCAAAIGIEILETACQAGEREEGYKRLGFREYGRLPRRLTEPSGGQHRHDEVLGPFVRTVDICCHPCHIWLLSSA